MPSRYSSIIASSASAMVSSSRPRHSSAASVCVAGMSTTSYISPSLASAFQTSARIRTRSMTPLKSASAPIGSCITSGVAPRRVTIMSTQRWNSAPVRSSLLTKQMRGTP